MIRVHLADNWQADAVDVYLVERTGMDESALIVPGRGAALTHRETRRADGHARDDPAPSFTIPRDALEALLAAAGDYLPPSSAMAEHLADVRAERDRLFRLVEAGAVRGLAAPARDYVLRRGG